MSKIIIVKNHCLLTMVASYILVAHILGHVKVSVVIFLYFNELCHSFYLSPIEMQVHNISV